MRNGIKNIVRGGQKLPFPPPISLVIPRIKVIEFRTLREMSDSASGVLFWPINLSFSFEVTIKAGNNKLHLLR